MEKKIAENPVMLAKRRAALCRLGTGVSLTKSTILMKHSGGEKLAYKQGNKQERSIFTSIQKRDGRIETFRVDKIQKAILAAGTATGEFGSYEASVLAMRVLTVAHQMFICQSPTVEQIQDIVEEVLLTSLHKKTAKAYIIYRDQHQKLRQLKSAADVALVEAYLNRDNWKVNENSNMTYSLQGLNNYISSEVSKLYWLNKIYPPAICDGHKNGDFHIHDLGLLSVYCVGWDLHDLLCRGFRGAVGKAESLPAGHFKSALGQIVNFFYTLQGEAAGAQAFSNFDTLLAPFVYYDNLDYEQVKKCLQTFVFNLNVPTRVGFQTPFTNITLDLKPSPNYASEQAIVGGVPVDKTYGEFHTETKLISRALFEVLAEGDAKGRVFTFPIPTVNIDKNFDFDDPDLGPLWEATARYGIPYFSNFVNSDMAPEDARSMCCRLRLDLRHLDHRSGGLFGANPLTGSIGVVTINMPRLGKLAASKSDFFEALKSQLLLARDSLEIKRKTLEKLSDDDLYPYTKFYLANIKKRYGTFWHNHFSTIGVVGINEAAQSLIGYGVGHEKGRDFALQVLDFIRDQLTVFQAETGHYYNLEATPAEGAGYRMARLDSLLFNEPLQGYSNSSQLPVDFTDDLFELLDLQDELQTKYTGGTVLHIFSGEAQTNPSSVKAFVKIVCHGYKLPYFTFTPTFSICQTHGYLSGEHEKCPTCGHGCEVYSRVVGYLRPVHNWHEGKQAEFKKRASFCV